MSNITNIQTRKAPVDYMSRGKKIKAEAVDPIVPMIVITSADTPIRTSACPIGAVTLLMDER
jgi:hypothetical protein